MSPFDTMAGAALSTVHSVFGSSTNFSYSRPGNRTTDPVASFSITAALNSGGEFSSPTGAYAGALLVKTADIEGGPLKGDLVKIASAPAPMKSGMYVVQEIFMDAAPGWASLMLRYRDDGQ